MREILFRGKRVDNGEWIEGYYYPEFDDLEIAYMLHKTKGIVFKVIPESVGQFTGLTDKNGVKIFEGDIFKRILNKDKRFDLKDDFSDYWIVEWLDDTCGFTTTLTGELYDGKYTTKPLKRNNLSTRFNEADEIIGNIHDNPELLTK